MQNAVTIPGDVYVSIVPFVKDVSVDESAYNSSRNNWIYWGTLVQDPTLSDNNSWDANNGTCAWNGCFTNRGPSSTPGTSGKEPDQARRSRRPFPRRCSRPSNTARAHNR